MPIDYKELIKGKNILVTGGLGSIGNEIVKQLVDFSPHRITIFDNRETEFFYWMEGENKTVFCNHFFFFSGKA